jgi:hypothetical protein
MNNVQSASMPRCRAHSGTCDQILLPVGRLLSESCGLVSVGLPLWREDGSAVFSAVIQWSESHRTHNNTLLSHLRLPNLEGHVPVFISPRNRVAQIYPRAAAIPRYIVSALTAKKTPLPLPSSGRCLVACFAVATQQGLYMSQQHWWYTWRPAW